MAFCFCFNILANVSVSLIKEKIGIFFSSDTRMKVAHEQLYHIVSVGHVVLSLTRSSSQVFQQ